MKVKVWGCRGSITSPGPTTVKYGGNTTCFEVLSDSGARIIIDAGSGIRELGDSLLPHLPIKCPVLITHTHYDHVIGYPFFVPFYVPGNEFDIYGPGNYEMTFEKAMTGFLNYSYFPVRAAEMGAAIKFIEHRPSFMDIGPFKIQTALANHPVTTFAYRIMADDQIFVFTGDHEPRLNHLKDDPYADSDDIEILDEFITENQIQWGQFLSNADLCIYDAQFTPEEYQSFVGWGHSAMDQAVDICAVNNVKSLLMTHHAPTRTDDQVDALALRWQVYAKKKGYSMEVGFATEKAEYHLGDA